MKIPLLLPESLISLLCAVQYCCRSFAKTASETVAEYWFTASESDTATTPNECCCSCDRPAAAAAEGTPAGERLVAEAAGALSRSITRSSRSDSCVLKSLSDCGDDDSQCDAGLINPVVAVEVAAHA